MARFLVRSVVSTIVTMFLVSVVLFFLIEVGSGDITVKILGIESTAEQRASYRAQLGLNQSVWLRYVGWLIGNDWLTQPRIGYDLVTVENAQTGEDQWWANVDGQLTRWEMEDGELIALLRQENGSSTREPADVIWQTDPETGEAFFWGVNANNSAVKWVRGAGETVWVRTSAGFRQEGDGPREYIPLRKGILRGDPGLALQTGRPVAVTLGPRLRNTAVLAAAAFIIVMPLALFFGIIAGVNEGKPTDRFISVTSLAATATPEFVTGIFLILILGIWLRTIWPDSPFKAVALFTSADAIFEDPTLLLLPVFTLTAAELGYVARMTRASMVEVMDSAYIRTAIIKGMPYRRVVLRHAIRNALMAPITIIMLHVNWLVGGVVVVEVIFGYPGLGKYIYDSAIFGDFNAIEAAAMVTVLIAVATRLIGDLVYTFLNPRIRYA